MKFTTVNTILSENHVPHAYHSCSVINPKKMHLKCVKIGSLCVPWGSTNKYENSQKYAHSFLNLSNVLRYVPVLFI